MTLLYRYSAVLFVAAWPALWWGVRAFGLLIVASAAMLLIAEAIHWCDKPVVDEVDDHFDTAVAAIRERNTEIEFARITDRLDDLRGYWPNEIGGVE